MGKIKQDMDQMSTKNMIVAMSGGVDSSTTAALLKQQGCKVRGVFMALGQPDLEQQIARVNRIAGLLEIPLEVVDLREPFQQQVLTYFRASYRAGRTPNPCAICNPTIKFGILLDRICESNPPGSKMATGHYARILRDDGGLFQLHRGRDPKKDQSYFLCRLQQEQLARVSFPLGELRKEEQVRGLAADFGLARLHGPESQDICFLKGTTVGEFMQADGAAEPVSGPIVTLTGETIGAHGGIHCYTVGQRRGLGIPDATPYYVVRLDVDSNRVVVGKEEDLMARRLLVRNVHWLGGSAPGPELRLQVKIRYRHRAAAAEILPAAAEGCLTVVFAEPQRALAPGQFAVFYDGDRVLGSGEIV
jgi:tRNA-uridine 2-sulfurtransferase